MQGVGVLVTLALLLGLPQCTERDPFVDDGFALIDEVVPASFEPAGKRSIRSDATRVYVVPDEVDAVAALDVPAGYVRDADTTAYDRADRRDRAQTLAVWQGPSPDARSTCVLRVRKLVAQPDRVEVIANCSLGAE